MTVKANLALATCLAVLTVAPTYAAAQPAPETQGPALAKDVSISFDSGAQTGAVLAVASNSASGAAQSADDDVSSQRTEVVFTPYLWIAGTSGELAIPRGDGEVDIDTSFTELLGNLKFAFMGTLDVRHDRFVALSDIMYLSVGVEAESVKHPEFVSGKVDAAVFVGTLAAGYRVVDQGPLFVDIVAGGRYTSLDLKVELEGPLKTRSAERSPSNISPLLGARARVPLSDNLGLVVYGDAGIGNSTVKWQALATAQWDISRHWRLSGGYRYMSLHRDKEDLEIDVALSGPIFAVGYRF